MSITTAMDSASEAYGEVSFEDVHKFAAFISSYILEQLMEEDPLELSSADWDSTYFTEAGQQQHRHLHKQCRFCGWRMRSDNLRRHVQHHFLNRKNNMPKKLEDMELAHGEWIIKPYWSAEKAS